MRESYVRAELSPRFRETVQTYRADLEGGRDLEPQLAGEDAARAIRGMLGLGDEPALGLEARFEAEAGLRIFFLSKLPGTVAAFLIWSDEVGACVAVNSAHPPEKRRWSLAHEMGHLDLLQEGSASWTDSERVDVAVALRWRGNFAPPRRDPKAEWYADLLRRAGLLG